MQLRAYFLFVLFVACVPLHLAFAEFQFESGEYETLRDIAENIALPYVSETTYFVGLGRSPAPIVAFFQETRSGKACTIPATKLKWLSKDLIDAAHREAIFKHFDEHLNWNEIGNKKLVIFDHTESALGLKNGGSSRDV